MTLVAPKSSTRTSQSAPRPQKVTSREEGSDSPTLRARTQSSNPGLQNWHPGTQSSSGGPWTLDPEPWSLGIGCAARRGSLCVRHSLRTSHKQLKHTLDFLQNAKQQKQHRTPWTPKSLAGYGHILADPAACQSLNSFASSPQILWVSKS